MVGLYGPWGDGKTSVLRLMEVALADRRDVVIVNFNAWRFGDEERLLRAFFATLGDALGRSLPTRGEEVGTLLKRYGSALSALGIGEAAKALGEALSSVEIDDLRGRLERILSEEQKRVLVLVDDIDRLDRKEIHALFKMIKLSASFKYTGYVLAFDDEMVAAALGEAYAGGGSAAGRNFLQKIVQVPLHLPRADMLELRRLTLEGVQSALTAADITLTDDQAQAFVRHFVDGLEPALLTPRQAKLFSNALLFSLPLLKGEVHPVDQMLIEGIRVFYPELYVAIRDNPDALLKSRRESSGSNPATQRAIEIINQGLERAGIRDGERMRRGLLEVLFPRLKGVFGNTHYGSDWDNRWTLEQRICSEDYFPRYFTYAVPPGDVSDLAITEFLTSITSLEETEVDQKLQDMARHNAVVKLVRRLRHLEEAIEENAARPLALALARNGNIIPREQQMLMSDWSRMQAAILISHLVRRMPSGSERFELATEIISISEPLPFSFECLRWLKKDDDSDGSEIIAQADEARLGEALAKRVAEKASTAPLYQTFGDDAPRLFWLWHKFGNPAAVREYLTARFESHSDEIDSFLGSYVGVAWGLESGLSHRTDFTRGNYDSVALLIDPEYVATVLKKRYGAELGATTYRAPHEESLSKRIAHQFVFLHHQKTDARDAPC